MNELSHLTHEEYLARLSQTKIPPYPKNTLPKPKFVVPKSWDWRSKFMVGPINNQVEGQCGGAWAITPVEQVSSCCAIQMKRPFQEGNIGQIQSCAVPEGDCCAVGDVSLAYSQLKTFGIQNGTSMCSHCHRNPSETFCKVTTVIALPKGDPDHLKIALFIHGPVVAHMDASLPSFRFYGGGIYNDPSCSSTNLNHAVLIVGYGTTQNKEDYWIVKNSWGNSWGLNGYFHVARNNGNRCGITSLASSVVVSVSPRI